MSVEGEVLSDLAGAEVQTESKLNDASSSHFHASNVSVSVIQDAKEIEGVVAAGDEAVVAITTTTATTTTFSLASSDSGMISISGGHSNESSDGSSSSSYDDRSLSPATLTDSPLAVIVDETSTIPPQPSKQQQLQQHQAIHSSHAAVLNVKQIPTTNHPINGCVINGININGVDSAINDDVDVEEENNNADKCLDKDNVSDSDGTKTTREDRRNHGSNGCYSSSGVGGSGMSMEATHIDDNRSNQ